MNPDKPPCPIDCPNRRTTSIIKLFGWNVDPFEAILHVLILLILGVPAVRDTTRSDYGVEDAMKWATGLLGTATLVRFAPTERIRVFQRWQKNNS